jgi:hypothetical protein
MPNQTCYYLVNVPALLYSKGVSRVTHPPLSCCATIVGACRIMMSPVDQTKLRVEKLTATMFE